MATCNYVCTRKQTVIVDFFYIALITSIMFLSLSIAIIYIITKPFINYNIFSLYYDL